MDAFVVLDHRFHATPDGAVWTDGPFPDSFFTRYLRVFDSVRVLARVREVETAPGSWRRADGDGIRFARLPYYVGPWQYLRQRGDLAAGIANQLAEPGAVILRLPSQVGFLAAGTLKRQGRRFAVEAVGDPWDVFAAGACSHPLGALIRRLHSSAMRRLCGRAAAVSYVTEFALQRRYRPRPDAFTTHYSSIELGEEAFVDVAPSPRQGGPLRLVSVGSMEHL